METGTAEQVSQTSGTKSLMAYFRAMRPEHWIKNLVVLAAFLFALGDNNQYPGLLPLWASFSKAVGAMALFCIVSSAIYLLNDIKDFELDLSLIHI